MGTISDKLTYLNTTKTMLRDSLNKFGSNILTTDTFRSYDTKLNEIYDKLPKITQSGAGFTLLDVQNGQVDDFKMNGVDLEQNTTNGNQLVNFGSPTTDNPLITLSFNNEILTLTGESGQYVGIKYDLYNVITNSNNAGKTIKFGYKSISNITGSGSIAQINIYYKDSTPTIYRSLINRQGSISNTYTIPNDTSNIRSAVLVLYTNNGSPASTGSVTIEEPLVYFDNNNTYEPYTGGIASPNPNYPQEIKVVEGRQVITNSGKNLLNSSKIEKLTRNGITCSYNSETQEITFNGTCTLDNTLFQFNDINIYAKKNVTKFIVYYVSGTVENYFKLRFYDSNYMYGIIMDVVGLSSLNNKISSYSDDRVNTSNYTINTFRFNNGSVANNLRVKVMVTDDDNTDYEPYYNPVSYNIDLNLENIYLAKMPNTDYKNRIYKNNGNWYFEENVKNIVLDGSENWYYVNNSSYSKSIIRYRCDDFTDVLSTGFGAFILSSNFKGVPLGRRTENGIARQLDSSGLNIFIDKSITNNSLTNFKNWLSTNNVEVWYPLVNSVTTQITNTTLINQLESLYLHTGTNIITISNSNNIIPEIEITRLKELEKLA